MYWASKKNLWTDLSLLYPRIVVSDYVLVLHERRVGKHLVHRHLLVVTVDPREDDIWGKTRMNKWNAIKQKLDVTNKVYIFKGTLALNKQKIKSSLFFSFLIFVWKALKRT